MKKLATILIISLTSVIMLLCGCLETHGTEVVPIGGLLDYAKVNDEVIIKGRWFDWGNSQQIGDETGIIYVITADNVDASYLEKNIEYYFTGIIRYGKLPEHTNNILYFEILDIKTVES